MSDGTESDGELVTLGEGAGITGIHPTTLYAALVALGHGAKMKRLGRVTVAPRWCVVAAGAHVAAKAAGAGRATS